MHSQIPSALQSKHCPRCDTYKPIDSFSVDKRRKSGRCVHCKTCHKNYRQSNIEKLHESQKKNIDRINKDPQLLERRREQKSRYARERQKRFPELEKIRRHTRRAEIFSGNGSYTTKEWLALCEKYGNLCLCCKEKKPLTVDHVKAISLGGSNSIENIQPLCKSCNSRKGNKEIDYRPLIPCKSA